MKCSPNHEEIAYFEITDASKGVFIIKLIESEKISWARKILSGEEATLQQIRGQIRKKSAPYNSAWSFYLEPSSIEFFDYMIEVCDSTMELVEKDLASVGGAFLPDNYWCPWSSELIREVKNVLEHGR